MCSDVNEKISIAEARARRADPVWRRRHRIADITGATLVALLLVVPIAAGVLWRPLGMLMFLAVSLGGPAALWLWGPKVGLERRTALLVPIPVLGLFVVVPAVWRAAHLHLQHWQGPLAPPWGDTAWAVVGTVGAVLWFVNMAGFVMALI